MPFQQIYLQNAHAWRNWLSENHEKQKGVWLVYYKKHTGKPRVPYNEAVEEALCFGWIDSIVKRLDDERYMQKFTPRNPKSKWSASNKKRIEKLIGLGTMTGSGMRLVEIAKRNGKWDEETDAQKDFAFSEELRKFLKSNKKAFPRFTALPPSHQKQYTQWVMSAKKAETQIRRMEKMIKSLVSGEEMKMM